MERFNKKNVAACILLYFITCGIYNLYWIYTMTDLINVLANDKKSRSPFLVVVLSVITCGLYYLYWLYIYSGKLFDTCERAGVEATLPKIVSRVSSFSALPKIICLILGIFGLGFISEALMQNDLNKLIERC